MKNFLILLPLVLGSIAAEYVGNGNGNGNAYGVPSGSFTPPPSGPYPPSGWKPSGRRLLLPGESRNGYRPLDTGYGQPPSNEYGPSVGNQYVPSTGPTGPSGNGNGFTNGNGFSNGNGHHGNGNGHNGHGNEFTNGNGNGHNGNGHNGNGNGFTNGNGNGHNGNGNGFVNGNGHNGNGHNGNGHNGNGHNGNGHNGNGHNGNGFANGNGFTNGNGHNGNGNGNGHNGNGNGFVNGNGHNGNGNGHNGNGNGNGNGVTNGNGHVPTTLYGAVPTQDLGGAYPFVQLSVPAALTAAPAKSGGNFYSLYQLPVSYSTGSGALAALTSSNALSAYPVSQAAVFPSFQTSTPNLGSFYSFSQVPLGSSQALTSYPLSFSSGFFGNGVGQHYKLLTNGLSQNSNFYTLKHGH